MLLSSVMVVISTGGAWPAELAQDVIESPLWENELMLGNFAEVSQACCVVEALPEARPVDGGRISCPGSSST
jgi:hypothetical protein